MVWRLMKHEMRLLLFARQTWAWVCALQVVAAALFYWLILQFEYKVGAQLLKKTDSYGITEDAIHPYLAWIALALLFLVPLHSPNTFAHERRHQTLQWYRLGAVLPTTLVWAKFFTALLFWTLVLLSLALLPCSLCCFGKVDLGQLSVGLLAWWLMMMMTQALAMLVSTYCQQNIYAAIITFLSLLLLILVEWLAPYLPQGIFFKSLSLLHHLKPLLGGLIQGQDLAYFFGITGLCLILSALGLSHRACFRGQGAWRGLAQVSLLLILLGGLAGSGFRRDFSWNQLNSLHQQTEALLQSLKQPLRLELYLDQKSPNFEDSEDFLKKLAFKNTHVHYELVQPSQDLLAEKVAYLNLVYGEQRKTLDLSNSAFSESNFYRSLYQLLKSQSHWVAFLEGHGERDIHDLSDQGYAYFRESLKHNGASVISLNLQSLQLIPDNVQVLVLAGNRDPLFPEELNLILDYLKQGRHLLLLMDPQSEKTSLQPLLNALDLRVLPEAIQPLPGRRLDPNISLVSQYPKHPITRDIHTVGVFPWALGLALGNASTWQQYPLFTVKTPSGEQVLGVSLTSSAPERAQKVVVIGNTQFLANRTILNYANRDLGRRILDWLAYNDNTAELQPQVPVDYYFEFPRYSRWLYLLGFPLGLVTVTLALATLLQFQRRQGRILL